MADQPVGCAQPTGKVIGDSSAHEKSPKENIPAKEESMAIVRVGGKAPDFEAPAYHKGKFINVKLSDYMGKWLLICFYPGDFTFV